MIDSSVYSKLEVTTKELAQVKHFSYNVIFLLNSQFVVV